MENRPQQCDVDYNLKALAVKGWTVKMVGRYDLIILE